MLGGGESGPPVTSLGFRLVHVHLPIGSGLRGRRLDPFGPTWSYDGCVQFYDRSVYSKIETA